MITRLFKMLMERLHKHEWQTTEIKGGTLGLLYADRVCQTCGKAETRNSRWQWVEPFESRFEWEREDKATGKADAGMG